MSKNVPICSIIGHVDVGKTKLLDLMRSSSTEEASGITQQIGATLYNEAKLKSLAGPLSKFVDVDGLLMIDTPGHECFTAIRYVGMMVSDIVIILIDVFKGLQQETIRCLKYLRKNNKKIIFAVNKIDRIYGWRKGGKHTFAAVRRILKIQDKGALKQLEEKLNAIKVQLAMQEINAELYYKNSDQNVFVNIVPISAETGEGVKDLIALISRVHKEETAETIRGYVLDERDDHKHGKYYICVHKSGVISRGDVVKVGGEEHTIKRLLVINDQKEIKDAHKFKFSETITEPCGCGIIFDAETHLEPGSVYSDLDIAASVYKTDNLEPYMSDIGVTVVAPSRILMDAFVKTLRTEKVDMSLMCVGKIDKVTIIKAGRWIDTAPDPFGKKYYERYNTILCFDPSNMEETISPQIMKLAQENRVTIILANTIYKLIERYNDYIKEFRSMLTDKFPTVMSDVDLRIIPKFIFLKKSPLLFGVTVTRGELHKGEILEVNGLHIGRVVSIVDNKVEIPKAETGMDVCIKIENPHSYTYGVDFTADDTISNTFSEHDIDLRQRYSIQ